ncbi:hypothetical protein [Flavobacterium sp.]|uniref:hypothetical protein n=1 Tax=Flavobacterium sp. TaxID=239 RepID=UPI003264440F
MKNIVTTLLLISNLILFAQSNQFSGEYTRSLGEEGKHNIEYKLTLNPDGTFLFHSYSKIQGGIPPEVNKYGKGKWSSIDNLITFSANKEGDFDEQYTLDFNKTTARFTTKSSRDKSDRTIKTKLTFFDTKIFWLEKLNVFKV